MGPPQGLLELPERCPSPSSDPFLLFGLMNKDLWIPAGQTNLSSGISNSQVMLDSKYPRNTWFREEGGVEIGSWKLGMRGSSKEKQSVEEWAISPVTLSAKCSSLPG